MSFARSYTDGPSYGDIFEAYLDNVDPCSYADESVLTWSFKDLAGCANRSANAWLHWLTRAIDVEWDVVVGTAHEHGLTVAAHRPTSSAQAARTGVRFLQIEQDLWMVDSGGLYGAAQFRSLADLSPEERRRHAEATAACQCLMCARLRPDPAVLDGFLASLGGAGHGPARTAAWFLARADRQTPEILTAIIEAGGRLDDYEGFAESVDRYARNLPGAWAHLWTLLSGLREPVACELALGGVQAIHRDAGPTSDGCAEYRRILQTAIDRDLAGERPQLLLFAEERRHQPEQ